MLSSVYIIWDTCYFLKGNIEAESLGERGGGKRLGGGEGGCIRDVLNERIIIILRKNLHSRHYLIANVMTGKQHP